MRMQHARLLLARTHERHEPNHNQASRCRWGPPTCASTISRIMKEIVVPRRHGRNWYKGDSPRRERQKDTVWTFSLSRAHQPLPRLRSRTVQFIRRDGRDSDCRSIGESRYSVALYGASSGSPPSTTAPGCVFV
jgi:hypothetical protein